MLKQAKFTQVLAVSLLLKLFLIGIRSQSQTLSWCLPPISGHNTDGSTDTQCL